MTGRTGPSFASGSNICLIFETCKTSRRSSSHNVSNKRQSFQILNKKNQHLK